MGTISLVIPQLGVADTTEDVKVQNAFTTIQAVINGNIDSTNVSATLAQSAAVNQSGQTVKGATSIATSQSTSSTTYTTLATPDQVSAVVLPANGIISVWYQATWQESVVDAARAAIFIGSNQLVVQSAAQLGVFPEAARTGASGANVNRALCSWTGGLITCQVPNTADLTTGQAVGLHLAAGGGAGQYEVNASRYSFPSDSMFVGGRCDIFAAAGTYAVSVQFKASSGTVTASNRKLWVQASGFA